MFRLEENVPEIYVNKSRDFQLLCRLKDLSFNAVKYSIDSIRHTSNTREMNSSLLPLLKSKVGFFADETLTEDQLRYLLIGFPSLIRNKGSQKAIFDAVHLWFRVYQLKGKVNNVIIINRSETDQEYTIKIFLATTPRDTSLLDAIFKYILPTGYIVRYEFSTLTLGTSTYQFNIATNDHEVRGYDNAVVHKQIDSKHISNMNLTQTISTADIKFKDAFASPEESIDESE